jgi:hypothetical protein
VASIVELSDTLRADHVYDASFCCDVNHSLYVCKQSSS